MDPVALVLIAALSAACIILALELRRARRRLNELPLESVETERALADEHRLRAMLEAQAQATAEASTDAILVATGEARVHYLNRAAAALFGAGPDAAGHSVIAVTRHPEIDRMVADALQDQSGELLDRQVVVGSRLFRARALRLPSAAGERASESGGVVIALQDVSELQRLGRARRDMVANIAHDLRTPITSIGLLVDTLTGGALADPELAAGLLGKIAVELDTLRQLAQEMFDLAQIESGQTLLRLVPTDMAVLANDVVARLAPQAERKQQVLTVAPPPGPQALADPEQVSRVLVNLLHNAVKFSPERGRIEVSWREDEEWVVLAVADDGPGIAPEDRERIFERFYRGDRSRAGEGSGLGLAIARHIVQGHGGRLWVESPHGRGATFYMALPRA